MIIFGDGAGFLSPFTGEPEEWLSLLDHWPHRALLTPELSVGYCERALEARGMRVLPANEDGLADIPTAEPRPAQSSPGAPFPRLILDRPRRWLERHAPSPEAIDALIEQLRGYLDAGGWLWLRACAVYPVPSWETTLYLGVSLLGNSDDFESRLLSLVRLPWLRHGAMPDWLRSRLIDSFSPQQERAVRHALETMLSELYDRGEIHIDFAEPLPAARSGLLQRLNERLAALRRRGRLAEGLDQEPEESPLRDAIFLGFLAGRRVNRLSVPLTEPLRDLLLPRGQLALGLRSMVMAFAAEMASELLRRLFPPVIQKPTPAPEPAPIVSTLDAPFIGSVLAAETVDLGGGVVLELVSLSAGEFTMGGNRDSSEQPRHRVRVSPFAIGRYPLTQAQWKAIMGEENNPSYFKGDDLPVETVSWGDVQKFIRRLNKKIGQRFRLPTEAEWEYAARGGSPAEYCFGDDEKQLGAYAWFGENSQSQTHPVGKKKPNPFGLFDMHGNVWEWCSDWYGGDYYEELEKQGVVSDPQGPIIGSRRVLRGGGWRAGAVACRSADRGVDAPGARGDALGFRLVRADP